MIPLLKRKRTNKYIDKETQDDPPLSFASKREAVEMENMLKLKWRSYGKNRNSNRLKLRELVIIINPMAIKSL